MEKIIIGKCLICNHHQDLKIGDEPECEKCLGPMIAERAEFREDFL